jgi:hypothetical protein
MDTISSLLSGGTSIDERTLVFAVNECDVPFTIKHEGTAYLLEPQKRVALPYTAACLWFGDPRSRDRGGRENHRTYEMNRLRFKWGIHTDPVPDKVYDSPGCAAFPKVTVTDLEGAHIPTVIDDPEGVILARGGETPTTVTPAQMQAQMDALQAQMNAMLEQAPVVVPDAPVMAGVERPDGTMTKPAAKPSVKRGPKRDGT